MALWVPIADRKIANLQDDERIIGIDARTGEDSCTPEVMTLKICCRLALDDILPLEDLEAEIPHIQYLRCGWIRKPEPDNQPGTHDAPLGKLWVVYRRTANGK